MNSKNALKGSIISAVVMTAVFAFAGVAAAATGMTITPSTGSATYVQGAALTSSDTTLSSDHDDTGLTTEITLTDDSSNAVNFDSVFSSFSLSTDGDGPYDLVALEPGQSTLTYGPAGGYPVTAGTDQVTTLTGGVNATAPVGTYTITTEVLKGTDVQATATYTLTVTAPDLSNVYVDAAAGDDTNDGSEAHPFKTLEKAVSTVPPSGTIHFSGIETITSAITLSTPVTIIGEQNSQIDTTGADYVLVINPGAAGTTIQGIKFNKTDTVGNTAIVWINADNVSIIDNTFAAQYNVSSDPTTRGLTISSSTGLDIHGNTFSHLRQPAYINDVTGVVHDNYADNTKGWVVVSESHITFTDNTWGSNAVDIAIIPNSPAGTDNYSDVAALSAANNNAFVVNKAGASTVSSSAYVDGSTGSDSNDGGSNTPLKTIQAGVDRVVSGGTVHVAAGTYDSFLVVGKSNISITGADKATTIVAPTTLVTTGKGHKYTANMHASVFVDGSTDVTIQNMTIKSDAVTPGSVGADAIVFWNNSTGTLKNDAVTGVYTISGAQTGQGIAVDAGAGETSDLTIDSTDISGFQKNGIDAVDGNGGANAGTVTVHVTGGSITGVETDAIAQNGILVWNQGGGTVTGTVTGTTISGFNYTGDQDTTAAAALAFGGATLTINESNLSGNQFAVSTDENTADATKNYWGAATGPAADQIEGDVTFSPWYKDAGMTTLTNGTTITTATATTSSATTDGGIETTMLIASGTEISGTDWDGVIEQPTIVASQGVAPSNNNSVTSTILSIEVGSTQSMLTLSKAAKLTFEGQGSALVGWSFNGGEFHKIGSCAANITDQASADANLAAGADCKMDVSGDLVVWTKHLTIFSVYTETTSTTSGGGGGGGGGNGPIAGGGGGGGGGAVALPNNGGGQPSGNTGGSTGGTTGGTTGGGQVLGASTFNFTSDLTIGSTGNQVIELQKFLIAQGFSIPSLTNGTATYGYFGAQTRAAVAKYQSTHGITPAVGYFGPITRASVNATVAPTMTDAQRAALIASFTAQLNALMAQLNALIAARAAGQTI